jgi:hypothetical protein
MRFQRPLCVGAVYECGLLRGYECGLPSSSGPIFHTPTPTMRSSRRLPASRSSLLLIRCFARRVACELGLVDGYVKRSCKSSSLCFRQ